MSPTKQANGLASEKSPYLLQHAYNPVQWYPWGEEAFSKAKEEDKPIFLSIGYSTCHWCHVMERESFEDQEVAAVLNKYYVAIKVDREERPDVDAIYMSVCQALTGSGGWPLTIIMTPDKLPFFAGTYFPKESSRGLPGVMDLLTQIAHKWAHDRTKLTTSGQRIAEAVQQSLFASIAGALNPQVLDQAYRHFSSHFDADYGGFGTAPKFPTPHNLSFLLRYWKATDEERALAMVEKTLTAMYQGGIYDHLGYGFARYSTDPYWLVPHFEKMVYDNALLAIVYLEAFQATAKEEYAQAAREIFTYVFRTMTAPEGAFYSAEDADSEGEEGKFYVWTVEEVKQVLGEELGTEYCKTFNITPQGNFEGKSIPNLIKTGILAPEKAARLAKAREALFQARSQRIHPAKDDKILTAWNGLMIAALAYGARALGEEQYAKGAAKAVNFLRQHLCQADGRLLARYRDGEAAYLGYADDYAFLIWGLIELYQATFQPEYLNWALELNTDLIKYFWDEAKGGLYLYGSDAEQLIARPKEIYDGAMPSANSVAALNFLRLAVLTGQSDLEAKAEAQFKAFGGTVGEAPAGYTHLLMAFQFQQAAKVEVMLVGQADSADFQEMLNTVNQDFAPELLLAAKAPGSTNPEVLRLIPLLEGREALEGKATAYVCKNFSCQPPTVDVKILAQLL